MCVELDLPANYKAEEMVIGTLLSNPLVYGGRMIEYGLAYINKNWFYGSFYQDIFTVLQIFRKEHKEINKMNVAQYMVEHDMGDATDIYSGINAINAYCVGEEEFWRFVKLIERLHWQREQRKLMDYLASMLRKWSE